MSRNLSSSDLLVIAYRKYCQNMKNVDEKKYSKASVRAGNKGAWQHIQLVFSSRPPSRGFSSTFFVDFGAADKCP